MSSKKAKIGIALIGLYLAVWFFLLIEKAIRGGFAVQLYWGLHLLSAGLALGMIGWAYVPRRRPARWQFAAWSLALVLSWQSALFITDALVWDAVRAYIARWGTLGLFFIGLAWVIWLVDRAARHFKQHRDDARQQSRLEPWGFLQADLADSRTTVWNPLNPDAWYYGREKNKKLNQSLVTLGSYTLAFVLAVLVLTNLRGCKEAYDLPAGGGQEKTIAQTVKIQKIIRKKYIINPYSAIIFNERKIDDVKLQLTKITEHAYTVGQGQGTGAGFGGGKPRGQVRFIRLEYDGGDWNQDFGVGGDLNMLTEYGIRTQHKVAKKTEARRITELANFQKYRSPPMVYITGQRRISTSKKEEKVLREYLLDNHGMIFCDNGGSRGFHNQFLSLMNRVLPEVRPVPVPLDDKIHRVPFAIPFLPYVAPHGGKEALGWYKDGRWVCYYHPGDIGDAWADGHAGVKPEVYEACYQLGTNVMFYANAEYSKWVQAQKQGT